MKKLILLISAVGLLLNSSPAQNVETKEQPVRFIWDGFYWNWKPKSFKVLMSKQCWSTLEIQSRHYEFDTKRYVITIVPGFQQYAIDGDWEAKVWVVANRHGRVIRPY